MYVYAALLIVHVLLLFLVRYLTNENISEETIFNTKYTGALILTVLSRSRSLLAALLRMNVFFEWAALYVLIQNERKKSVGSLLYQAKQQRDKKFLRQELCIRTFFRLMCAFLLVLRLFSILIYFDDFERYMDFNASFNDYLVN